MEDHFLTHRKQIAPPVQKQIFYSRSVRKHELLNGKIDGRDSYRCVLNC